MQLERLAYVDDDDDIREIVRFALTEVGGLDVRCWGDGAAFLAEPQGDWRPQLLLLDLTMPGLSGGELVITSYSIHYTKLYENLPEELEHLYTKSLDLFASVRTIRNNFV